MCKVCGPVGFGCLWARKPFVLAGFEPPARSMCKLVDQKGGKGCGKYEAEDADDWGYGGNVKNHPLIHRELSLSYSALDPPE